MILLKLRIVRDIRHDPRDPIWSGMFCCGAGCNSAQPLLRKVRRDVTQLQSWRVPAANLARSFTRKQLRSRLKWFRVTGGKWCRGAELNRRHTDFQARNMPLQAIDK